MFRTGSSAIDTGILLNCSSGSAICCEGEKTVRNGVLRRSAHYFERSSDHIAEDSRPFRKLTENGGSLTSSGAVQKHCSLLSLSDHVYEKPTVHLHPDGFDLRGFSVTPLTFGSDNLNTYPDERSESLEGVMQPIPRSEARLESSAASLFSRDLDTP